MLSIIAGSQINKPMLIALSMRHIYSKSHLAVLNETRHFGFLINNAVYNKEHFLEVKWINSTMDAD